ARRNHLLLYREIATEPAADHDGAGRGTAAQDEVSESEIGFREGALRVHEEAARKARPIILIRRVRIEAGDQEAGDPFGIRDDAIVAKRDGTPLHDGSEHDSALRVDRDLGVLHGPLLLSDLTREMKGRRRRRAARGF